MASPSLPPYEYEEIVELNYEFVNRDGIRYHLYFTPMDVLYPDMVNTYSFNIEREGSAPHSIDRRIAATVIDILTRFFEKMENAMIMVCDNTDGKQEKRRVLFNRWFDFYNDGTLSSRSAEVREGYYQLLVSIYFKNDNPNKQKLVSSFNELMSRDIYEIVV